MKKKPRPGATSNTMLCFAPRYNTKGRKDATGAFIPEAKRFLAFHDQEPTMLHLVDNNLSPKWMREAVLSAIRAPSHRLEGVFFFCHGYRSGIQFGITKRHVDDLAKAIHDACGTLAVVVFYSCDVARDADRKRTDDLATIGGDGGFADEVRDALCRAGADYCTVDGHTTAGHCTRNPHVRRFCGDGSRSGGSGGYYIVPRQKAKLFKKWRKLLGTDMRFEYPFMDAGRIMEIVEDA
jgi:hypothetical protein